jgi:arylsulfatase A-like enzyme
MSFISTSTGLIEDKAFSKSALGLLVSFIFLVNLSCSMNSDKNPNLIVIAVEGLGFNQVDCLREDLDSPKSGFKLLCERSVRYTHAFTNSIQTIPGLASILTGRTPLEIKKLGQNFNFLPSTERSLAEDLYTQGIPTAFFSGGAPILRRANLHQGFEVFDDFFKPTLKRSYRPFSQLISQYQNWRAENGRNDGLTVFYLSDLLQSSIQTFDDLGKSRNLSFDSQLEEIDETLGHFLDYLKKEKIFDKSYIILLGTSGPFHQSREAELSETNVFSERAQITLLIKPPQKMSDKAMNQTINQNVSLADVGKSLFSIFQVPPPAEARMSLSLINNETGAPEPIPENRWILTQARWNQDPNARWALRNAAFLFILDEKWKIFNTLIDRTEFASIPIEDSSISQFMPQLKELITDLKVENWVEPSNEISIKWRSLSAAFQNSVSAEEKDLILQKAAHRLVDDTHFRTFYSVYLLKKEDWSNLQKWAEGIAYKDLEKLALLNQGKTSPQMFLSPCLAALEAFQKFGEVSRKCDEKLSYQFLEWLQLELGKDSLPNAVETAKNKFLRMYFLTDLDQRLAFTNWKFQAPFEYGHSMDHEVLTLEMMLSYPGYRKFRSVIEKELQSLHESINN